MQSGKFALERRKQIGVILERQFRVQTADDMQFGRAFGNGVSRDLDAFVNRMRVSVVLPRAAIKPAKFAVRDTDIRVIKMPVDVVISRPPVLPPPHRIRQFPQRIQIVGVI